MPAGRDADASRTADAARAADTARAEVALAVPRRWSDKIDGIRWLPRLIDKARMADAGTLGTYLFGQSPFDAALLRRLGTTTEEFGAIVAQSTDDDAVMARLRARGFDDARVRRWSDRLTRSAYFYIPLWDLDDGYKKPRGIGVAGLALWRVVERPVIAILRAVLRAP